MRKNCLKYLFALCLFAGFAWGQTPAPAATPSNASVVSETTEQTPEFGPIVSAYLSYLRDEQVVTDDRASHNQITPAYYRRNTNRIRALRAIALRLARESQTDYLPELVAVARDEFHTIFFQPPKVSDLRETEIYADTFRYLSASRGGSELFYIFARLDPYEREEWLKEKSAAHKKGTKVEP